MKPHTNGNGDEGTHNCNILSISRVPSPEELKKQFPMTKSVWRTVHEARMVIPRILLGEDERLLVVVGPCSVHNTDEVIRYARRLVKLATTLKDRLYVVMRVCCDKPRSKRSWTGFFNDPDMDGSCNIAKGWTEGRRLMLTIAKTGLPIAVEFLSKDSFQNIDDLVSYTWIGARNVQSQMHRQVTSGLSTPVGFKNPNFGPPDAAIDAIDFARHSNVFVASNDHGIRSRFLTKGNYFGHLILRGADGKPNYDAASIQAAAEKLTDRGLISRVIVDVSHDNSQKDHRRQRHVIGSLLRQIGAGSHHVAGIMYESYLLPGKQSIPRDLSELKSDVSVTDGCDGWEETKATLRDLHAQLGTKKS